ncbi:hypothetical protein [Chryseobacterium hagamense]|uniref:hypothetical protein n=1 Tax=Chryseobacterium hagamense TaxID=395935 RepID=UPI0011BE44BB|nr:hypothetical protein [Chryseobacterium hagamense]
MKYPIKVWLFTNLVPVLGLLIKFCFFKFNKIFDPFILKLLLLGFIFSGPAMIGFRILDKRIENISIVKSKIILSIYSFVSVWITLFILNLIISWIPVSRFLGGYYGMALFYILFMILGIWGFKRSKSLQLN